MASYFFANNPRNAEGNEAYVAAVWHYDFDVGSLLIYHCCNCGWRTSPGPELSNIVCAGCGKSLTIRKRLRERLK
jgi:hypothetical protein